MEGDDGDPPPSSAVQINTKSESVRSEASSVIDPESSNQNKELKEAQTVQSCSSLAPNTHYTH